MKILNLLIKGYTLLELLLVILIMSIIATVGLLLYQQNTTNSKVSQTVQQLQQLMEAASAYYVDNNCWPNDPQCAPSVLKFDQYIPFKNLNNPWGGTYTFQIEPNYGKKFQVFSGTLPANIANRVVALLPNTATDTKQTYVITETNVPGSSAVTNNLIIANINQIPPLNNKGSAGFIFRCPHNWLGRLVLTYNYIHPYDAPASLNFLGSLLISTLDAGNASDPSSYCTLQGSTNTQDTYGCLLTVEAISRSNFGHKPIDLGNASFSYIAYCLNPGVTDKISKRLPKYLF